MKILFLWRKVKAQKIAPGVGAIFFIGEWVMD